MAKGKRKGGGGMSGVSRFVLASMTATPPDSNQGTGNSGKAAEIEVQADQERSLKKQKVADVSYATPDRLHISSTTAKYDASGLVPHYSREEEVPDHLRKCTLYW